MYPQLRVGGLYMEIAVASDFMLDVSVMRHGRHHRFSNAHILLRC